MLGHMPSPSTCMGLDFVFNSSKNKIKQKKGSEVTGFAQHIIFILASCLRVSVAVNKDYDQNQLGEESVHLILNFQETVTHQ